MIVNGIEMRTDENVNAFVRRVLNVFDEKQKQAQQDKQINDEHKEEHKEEDIKLPEDIKTYECYKCGDDEYTKVYYITKDNTPIYICSNCLYKSNIVKCLLCELPYNVTDICKHMESNEHKKEFIKWCNTLNKKHTNDTDTSDDDTDTSDYDTDTSDDDNDTQKCKYTKCYKRLILTTYGNMADHDETVKQFNHIYDTEERGSNGCPGQYFTHGEKSYMISNPIYNKLRSLYAEDCSEMSINGQRIKLDFIDVKPPIQKHTPIPQQTVLRFRRKIERSIKEDNYTYISDCRMFMDTMEQPYIQNNMLKRNKVTDRKQKTFQVNDIIHLDKYKLYSTDYHDMEPCMAQVLTVYKNGKSPKIKIAILEPKLIIEHYGISKREKGLSRTVRIYKVKKHTPYDGNKIIKIEPIEYELFKMEQYLLMIHSEDRRSKED